MREKRHVTGSRTGRVALVLLALLGAGTIPRRDARAEIVVLHTDGRRESVPTREVGHETYLSAADISLVFGASLYWRPDLFEMTVRLGEHRVKVAAENPNVVVDGKTLHLRSPVLYREGEILLPLELAAGLLVRLAPFPIRWDDRERTFLVGSRSFRILGAALDETAGGVEVTVRTSGRPPYREEAGPEGAVLLRFPGAVLVTDTLAPLPERGLLARWFWEEGEEGVTLHLLPAPDVRRHRVDRHLRPEEIAVRLSASPIDELAGGISEAIGVLMKAKKGAQAKEKVVVIDPGHGGADRGCFGSSGLVEKEVTLDIALRLRDLLGEEYGVTAILTRDEDIDPSIRERTESANEARAALFVSLHMSGLSDRGGAGAEFYLLAHGRGARERIERASDEIRSVFEGEPLGGIVGGDLRFVPWDAVQESHAVASAEAARIVRSELARLPRCTAREIREAPIAVLRGADMPAFLLELRPSPGAGAAPFLEGDEGRDAFSRSLARAIARAVGVEG